MEKGPNFHDDFENDDSENKDGKSKRTRKKLNVPLPISRPESEKPTIELPKEKSAEVISEQTLLEKLTSGPEKTEEQGQAQGNEESSVEESNEDESTAETPVEFQETLEDQYVQSIAEDLSVGQEISLHEVEQVPEARDEEIIDQALEIADDVYESAPAIMEILPETDETEPIRATSEAAHEFTPPPIPVPERTPETSTGDTLPSFPSVPNPRHNEFQPPTYNSPPAHAPSQETSLPAPQPESIRKIAEDAAWSERQRGRREGVFSGLLLGGGIEHFRHKRREKKREKQYKKEQINQEKRVERLEQDYATARKAQEREVAAHEQTKREQQLAQATAEKEKKAKEAPQQLPEVESGQEQLHIPKDHHVEQSAWHSIEVDKQGKAVENGSIEYGHEYYQERKHESAPRQPVNETAGEVALVAAAIQDQHDAEGQEYTPGSATTDIEQDAVKPTSTKKSAFQTITTPPSTPLATVVWLVVLIVLVVGLFVVIR